MTSFQAAVLVIGLLVIFGVPALWWVFNSGPSVAQDRASSERFRQRQLHPDYIAFERRYGVRPPESLQSLIADPALFISGRDMFTVQLPPCPESDGHWFVDSIYPIDEEQLSEIPWPGAEDFFPFAGNGAGDQYLIDPRNPNPQVFYYEHETGKRREVGVRLSEFLAAQRDYDEEP